MSVDLMDLLHAGTTDPDEFEYVLSSNFLAATQSEPNIIEYLPQQNSEECALRLIYDGGELRAIESGPLLEEASLEKIRADVEEKCLRSHGMVVARTPLFAALPVNEWWRYRDEFQILPVPPDAPRPDQFVGAHPFVLEVAVSRSPDMFVQMLRRDRSTREVELVLGSILWKILDSQGQPTGKHWVYLPPGPEGLLRSAFLQGGYDASGIRAFLDEFTPPGDLSPMSLVADEDYFAQEGLHVEDVLKAPESLTSLVDLYFKTPSATKDKFMRFSYWLMKADTFWPISTSGSYVAVVSAIEALMGGAPSGRSCPACGKDVSPGPTARFRAFVERWSSASDAAKLYQIRSAITHGSRIMRWDMPGFPFNPAANADDSYHRDAFRAARRAGVRWLASTDSERSLGSDGGVAR